MANVLFVCRQNAGRSQMSQALFNQAAAGRHEGRSAGSTPAEHVHPEVIQVMDEVGLDLREQTPTPITQPLAEWADVVVTMGCGDACPYVPGTRYVDWDLPDPSGQDVDAVRVIRDEIGRRVTALAEELEHHGLGADPGTSPRGHK